ncbi:AmmeMemoRadiSam system radical SAM enzyme [Candidatus Woesearchaeota archaeon]|nr:AmmeMemoRadiSam system radical SAM enzyme [Candidatus Woesearchaeota archaeon]
MKQALFAENNKCVLCPHNCIISEGKRGICGVRINKEDNIYALVYGRPCSIAIDPIEKKPLYHFFPGKSILSFGTVGCNFRCKGCQNWEIATAKPEKTDKVSYPPKKIVETAKEKGCDMIAYTYTEPTVFYEYMIDTAKIAKKQGMKNVIVSNGYINEKPLRELCKVIDAANIDLKFFNNEKYMKYSSGKLEPILKSLKILKEEGVWLEITNLLIPGLSDDLKEFEEMCKWIKENLGEDVPLHISRFFPHFKLGNVSPTPIETMEKAKVIAKKYLRYVYLGNVPYESNTICPKCNNLLIKRDGYNILNNLEKGCCVCKEKIPGSW